MIVNSVVVYQQTDGRSTTSSAGNFDSTIGASGPINPLRSRGAAARGAPSTWVAVAAAALVAAFI
jgi:hypothetical protein